MLIEQLAYGSRWRRLPPAAKGLFALGGMAAAFAAPSPPRGLVIALAIAAATVIGAGIPVRRYLAAALPPLSFLAVSAATLPFSVAWAAGAAAPSLQFDHAGLQSALQACGRSLAILAALLFYALSTPMTDTIALLRRLRAPEPLLDIMTICHRMLFVFSEAVRDMARAQRSRLGYATARHAVRSLGILAGNLTLQIWRRSVDLHHAALARNGDGPLRFIEPEYPAAGRAFAAAALGGVLLIAIAVLP